MPGVGESVTPAGELALLCDREAWSGGFYELSIQLGPADDERLGQGVRALAGAGSLDGPWHVQWQPDRIAPAAWTVAGLSRGHLRGLVTLPGGQRGICSVVCVREEGGDDWLDLCLPLEALSRLDVRVGGFPFGPDGGSASLAWRRPVDDWLAGVAGRVREACGFRLAVIGFEVSGQVRAEEMAGGIPAERGYALLLPGEAGHLPATI
jgi:hypothetical protein